MVIVRMCDYFIADFRAVRSLLDMFLWCTVDRVVGLYHAESIRWLSVYLCAPRRSVYINNFVVSIVT
jgi:hypothetical protein